MGCRGNIARIDEQGKLRIFYTHSGATEIAPSLGEGPSEFWKGWGLDAEQDGWLDDVWSEGSCLIDEQQLVILIHRETRRPVDDQDEPNLRWHANKIEEAWEGFTVIHVDNFHEIVRYAYYRGLATFEQFRESWAHDEEGELMRAETELAAARRVIEVILDKGKERAQALREALTEYGLVLKQLEEEQAQEACEE